LPAQGPAAAQEPSLHGDAGVGDLLERLCAARSGRARLPGLKQLHRATGTPTGPAGADRDGTVRGPALYRRRKQP